ncbi:hypothetical protein KI387_012341, partial [Taxus chinensis]
VPEHKKMALEYFRLKEEKTALGRNINIMETPPIIEEPKAPLASKELDEPLE